MKTYHRLIIGDCSRLYEIKDSSVHLVVTSPPYYNAPFDYQGLYKDYNAYLNMISKVSSELHRVLHDGRIAIINIDDMLVDGVKYPITADVTSIMQKAGFNYRDRIVWKKPDGYLRISRRSGVLLKNPYPMYFYPDNLLESILIFQKGKFDYKSVSQEQRDQSTINIETFRKDKWYPTLWEICNVLPGSSLEKGIAAFPEEIPRRLITLFSYKGEVVLDPFLGSGTTMKVARELGRNSIGVEIMEELQDTIRLKCSIPEGDLVNLDELYFDVIVRKREDA